MKLKNLQVVDLKKEVNEVLCLTLKPLQAEDTVYYQSGQFLTLVFNSTGKEIRRSYSIMSSPFLIEPLQIAVKLIDNGEISRPIHEQLQIGDILRSTQANGFFIYHPDVSNQRTVFLFAAGVGITPLFSILKTALVAEKQSKICLIYSNRSVETALFYEQLNEWQEKYPDRLKIIYLFSNSKNLRQARLNSFLITDLIDENLNFLKENALFYTCGPVDYMDLCRIAILGAGFSINQFNKETFVLPEEEQDEDDTTEKIIDKSTYSVNLIIRGINHSLSVPYPKRILEVALENNIPIPYSCSGGVCGTCVAQCTSGSVKMAYNEILTDDEVAEGRVLVCTGQPTMNETTITWN